MLAALALALAVQEPEPVRFDAGEVRRILQHLAPDAPPPDPTNRWADDPAAARFGQRLFFDPRLSADGRVACSTCHDPARAFTDGRPASRGLADVTRNAPTLLNVAWQRWLFWDGRADTLWGQAIVPLEDPREMGRPRAELLDLFRRTPDLREDYERVFGALPADSDRFAAGVGKALAAYERRLVAFDSDFDRFAAALRDGDAQRVAAYPEAAKRGLRLFLGRAGCRSCHPGPLFSDLEFHDIGIPPRAGGMPADAGRRDGIAQLRQSPFHAAGPHSDERHGERARQIEALLDGPETWGQYKTPSLRNVARTAPYMHEGQLATLADVLRFYSTLEGAIPLGHHGETVLKPLRLEPREIDDLIAFLETLSGRGPAAELLR